MANRQLPPVGGIRQLLRYEPETGKMFWKERTPDMFTPTNRTASHQCNLWNARYANKEAFTSVGGDGYLKGTINGVYYLAHRVIWKLVHDEEPDEIDHKDGRTRRNVLTNLRNVTRGQNAKNLSLRRDNKSGVTGVYRKGRYWYAHIKANGSLRHLGTFDTIEEAAAARKAAEVAYGYHPNHGREAD